MRFSGIILNAIEWVLAEAEKKPADAALREILRRARFEQTDAATVSRAVFTRYRWLGFLDHSKPLRAQLDQAFELADQFSADEKSIPDSDLMERAVPDWAHAWARFTPALLREFQREPRLWLRARPGTGGDLAQALGSSELHREVPDAVWYHGGHDLYHTPEFRSGAFEIQDLSSQIVGHVCAPGRNETWWDACAGEGGKLLHLCDLMQNKGLVWATDRAEWRLATLKRRASRAKLFNYRIKQWVNTEHLPTKTKFNGILVDAPCSGFGTWGRNPHARWTARPEDVTELASLQSKILERVAGSLKAGGRLIYSVCTFTEAETSGVADLFESTHPKLAPLELRAALSGGETKKRLLLLPQALHANGMFVSGWQA